MELVLFPISNFSKSTMLNFSQIGLVLAVVVFTITILSYIPSLKGLTTPRNASIENIAKQTPMQQTDNNTTEKDGIQFEILVPKQKLTIPANKSKALTTVQFGLRITNKTQNTFQFFRMDTLTLDLIGSDGEQLLWIAQRRGSRPPTPAESPFLKPGESVVFFLNGQLSWTNDQLRLGGPDEFGGYWLFDNVLKAGSYKIRFKYKVYANVEPAPKYIWIGEVKTPFVDIYLVNTPI